MDSEPTPEHARPSGWKAALALLGLSVLWLLLVNLFALGVAAGLLVLGDVDLSMEVIQQRLARSDLIGTFSALQGVGLVVTAGLLLRVCRHPAGLGFALRPAGRAAWIGAFLVGGSIGIFAGWVGLVLTEQFPSLGSDHLDFLRVLLTDGPLIQRIPMFFAVVLVAPWAEEWLFRGALWTFLEDSFGPVAAMIATSLLFAAYHLDPLHVIGILPTAFALGAIRKASGSVWPGVLAHAVNNVLGLCAILFLEEDVTTGPALAMSALLVSVVGLLVCVRWGSPGGQDGRIG